MGSSALERANGPLSNKLVGLEGAGGKKSRFHALFIISKAAPDLHLCGDKQAGTDTATLLSVPSCLATSMQSGYSKPLADRCTGFPSNPLRRTFPRLGNPNPGEARVVGRGMTSSTSQARFVLWRRSMNRRRRRSGRSRRVRLTPVNKMGDQRSDFPTTAVHVPESSDE